MIKSRSTRRPAPPPANPEGASAEPMDAGLGTEIGRELRALYDRVVAEPVPDKLRQLLDELERKSGKA